MSTPRSRRALCTLSLLAAFACAGDPAREIENRRADYTASVTGFLLRDEPGRERSQVILDVLLAGEASPPLPGLTLDVSMAGPDGREKAHRRVYVDSSTVGRGGQQVALTFDDLPYAPGDGFWVEVRSAVPPAERSEYREFGARP